MSLNIDVIPIRRPLRIGTCATEMCESQSNRLLAALPTQVRSRLWPHLEFVPMPQGKVLYESGEAMLHIYFPIDCTISMLYVTENGTSTNISVVGNDGLIGVAAFMGGGSTTSRAVVQTEGFAYRVTQRRFKDEFNLHGDLMRLILRYTQSLIVQVSQIAMCNRHHSVEQQLCRWLLLSLDCLNINQLNMTQEGIANILGVRREGITGAAGKLQRLGVIEYGRGRITVLNRAKLEEISCECYAVIKNEADRLLPALQIN